MSDRAIQEAARTFAARLCQSEPIAALWQARARLEADQESQLLLSRLSERQRDLTIKQRDGGEITQGDIDDLRHLQRQALDNPAIEAYSSALQQAQLFLSAVNAELGDLLGFDFAALARVASV